MVAKQLKGMECVAERIANAQNRFVQVIEDKGFTREEAQKAMHTMLKLKVAKVRGKCNENAFGSYCRFDGWLG